MSCYNPLASIEEMQKKLSPLITKLGNLPKTDEVLYHHKIEYITKTLNQIRQNLKNGDFNKAIGGLRGVWGENGFGKAFPDYDEPSWMEGLDSIGGHNLQNILERCKKFLNELDDLVHWEKIESAQNLKEIIKEDLSEMAVLAKISEGNPCSRVLSFIAIRVIEAILYLIDLELGKTSTDIGDLSKSSSLSEDVLKEYPELKNVFANNVLPSIERAGVVHIKMGKYPSKKEIDWINMMLQVIRVVWHKRKICEALNQTAHECDVLIEVIERKKTEITKAINEIESRVDKDAKKILGRLKDELKSKENDVKGELLRILEQTKDQTREIVDKTRNDAGETAGRIKIEDSEVVKKFRKDANVIADNVQTLAHEKVRHLEQTNREISDEFGSKKNAIVEQEINNVHDIVACVIKATNQSLDQIENNAVGQLKGLDDDASQRLNEFGQELSSRLKEFNNVAATIVREINDTSTQNLREFDKNISAAVANIRLTNAKKIIEAKRSELVSKYPELQDSDSDVKPCPDNEGYYQHFGGYKASIHWHPSTGPVITTGAIRSKWASLQWEIGALGYPTSVEQDLMKDEYLSLLLKLSKKKSWIPFHYPSNALYGKFSVFQKGRIYWFDEKWRKEIGDETIAIDAQGNTLQEK